MLIAISIAVVLGVGLGFGIVLLNRNRPSERTLFELDLSLSPQVILWLGISVVLVCTALGLATGVRWAINGPWFVSGSIFFFGWLGWILILVGLIQILLKQSCSDRIEKIFVVVGLGSLAPLMLIIFLIPLYLVILLVGIFLGGKSLLNNRRKAAITFFSISIAVMAFSFIGVYSLAHAMPH